MAKNTTWNLLGLGVPFALAVFVVPILIRGMGTERFGLLTLAWAIIGYFGLFDLGVGRALTKLVADRLGAGQEDGVPPLVWTGIAFLALIGLAGALGFGLVAPTLVERTLRVPEILLEEAVLGCFMLAPAIAVVILSAGFRGVLEAYQRFDLVNVIRVPVGAIMLIGPLLVLPFSNRLHHIIAVLLIARITGLIVNLVFSMIVAPRLRREFSVRPALLKPLLFFGGWMMVTNVLSPLMVYLDRFLIGALISVAAVAHYATPWEAVTKLGVVSAALVGVLFPAFATSLKHDRDRAVFLYGRGMKYVVLSLFLPALLAVTFAQELLHLWLGEEFARFSTAVMQWLTIGVLLNALARVPFVLVQAVGRPDITAKLHIVELILYVPILWLAVEFMGTVGAAMAWTLRAAADLVALLVFSRKLLHEAAREVTRTATGGLIVIVCLAVSPFVESFVVRCAYFVLIGVLFLVVSWKTLLDGRDKRLLLERLKQTG